MSNLREYWRKKWCEATSRRTDCPSAKRGWALSGHNYLSRWVCSSCWNEGSDSLLTPIHSNDESHWITAEVNRNNETVQLSYKTPPNKSDNEGNEYGNDQGQNESRLAALMLTLTVEGGDYGGNA